ERVLEHDRSGFDLSTVRECDTGTSATPPELLAAIKDAFPGTGTRIYYGSTEVGVATMGADVDLAGEAGWAGAGWAGAARSGWTGTSSPPVRTRKRSHPSSPTGRPGTTPAISASSTTR